MDQLSSSFSLESPVSNVVVWCLSVNETSATEVLAGWSHVRSCKDQQWKKTSWNVTWYYRQTGAWDGFLGGFAPADIRRLEKGPWVLFLHAPVAATWPHSTSTGFLTKAWFPSKTICWAWRPGKSIISFASFNRPQIMFFFLTNKKKKTSLTHFHTKLLDHFF